ncbi:MAG: SCP2 sterol-binding domain-containing protein [Acidimicrobiales bacterium]
MAGFLTDAWFDELDAAGRASSIDGDVRLVIQQIVPDGDDGREVAYVVEATGGTIRVWRGRADAPDITFTQDRVTAEAIHRGELSAQTAFIEGRLRLGGDLRSVIDRASALAAIDDVFAAARA